MISLQNINSFLSASLGIKVCRSQRYSRKLKLDCPIEALYCNKLSKFDIGLPLNKAVTWRWHLLGSGSDSPLYLASVFLKNNIDKGDDCLLNCLVDFFYEYSILMNGKDAIEHIKSGEDFVYNGLDQPLSFVYPWDNKSSEFRLRERLSWQVEENKLMGYKSESYLGMVPPDRNKLLLESKRIYEIFKSIRNNGFDTNNRNKIGAHLLVSDGEYKWLVAGGQHRTAVLSALGYEKVHASVGLVIRREDYKSWPAVKKGIYNDNSALKVFDLIFSGTHPLRDQKWLDYVEYFKTKRL